MHRLCACLLLLASVFPAADDSSVILARARKSVAAQLARVANYACVQTIDRQYLVADQRLSKGCSQESLFGSQTLWMRDRLRLDVAVSEDREIYSWHGEAKFTSTDVADVVQNGPISSGNFTGFLSNIFLMTGTQFKYTGKSQQTGTTTYNFDFSIPLACSVYRVQGEGNKPTVPYHGSFSIDDSDYHVTRLQVVADAIPSTSPICSAETNITYQIVNISGHPAPVPASFVLDLQDNRHIHTISSSEYSQCREFRGESTLHFDLTETSSPKRVRQATSDGWLPAGLPLQIALRAPIDDRKAYVGDRVEGLLVRPFKLPGSQTAVPKGAVLEGIITKLEEYYRPVHFELCSIKFNHLTFGDTSLLLNASPKTSSRDENVLGHVYGSPLPALVAEQERKGMFVTRSSHLHLDRGFSAQWITRTPSSTEVAASSSSSQ